MKKKNKLIGTIINVVVSLVLLRGLLWVIGDSIDGLQNKVWDSGKVQILGKTIQLPCDVATFQTTFNASGDFSINGDYDIKEISIPTNNGYELFLSVYISGDDITAIFLKTENNNLAVASKVVFPENITVLSTVDEVKRVYDTKPTNSSYMYYDGGFFETHTYHGSHYNIIIKSDKSGSISKIEYYYE